MVENREKLVPGALCRHFKGNLYQIVSVAIHSETREEYVVYQALYGDFNIYVRPLPMFLSEVDHEKYPEITQRWRFEFIDRSTLTGARREAIEESSKQGYDPIRKDSATIEESNLDTTQSSENSSEENLVNEDLLDFLDARTYKDKLSILVNIKNRLDEQTLNHIAISMDIVLTTKTLEDQYEEVKSCLLTFMRFEDGRLR